MYVLRGDCKVKQYEVEVVDKYVKEKLVVLLAKEAHKRNCFSFEEDISPDRLEVRVKARVYIITDSELREALNELDVLRRSVDEAGRRSIDKVITLLTVEPQKVEAQTDI